ncbi:MAG: cell division ATP-binding protein FtsE [Pseudomonadota bacterium]|jgi:cell division transport system ATP-binding protein
MIEFQQVSKRYPCGHEALNNVSFCMAAREMAFLTGHSGAGKSTLLKLIMLMEQPSQGQVLIGGKSLQSMGRGGIPLLRRRIGVVFQNHHLLFDRSVYDNVALPLHICGVDHREIGRRVRAALDKVGLLDKEKAMPITLSGGEQQRVGIARAVVNKPALLLADEPTGNLDPELSAEIMQLFRDFNQVGVTVLIASHDIALIESMNCRRLVLDHGSLHEGTR